MADTRSGCVIFRQIDVAAAIRAGEAAGLRVEHAEIDYRGMIVVRIAPLPTRGPCVYFVETSPGSPVKIGFTKGEIAVRIKDLQTGSPAPLRLIAVAPAPRQAEAAVHRYLKSDRLIGEWFKRSRRVKRLIRAVGRGDRLESLLSDG